MYLAENTQNIMIISSGYLHLLKVIKATYDEVLKKNTAWNYYEFLITGH